MDKIRVLLVEDDPVWQQGLSAYISKEPDLILVGCAETKEKALELFQTDKPDVVLMDIVLTKGTHDGIDTALEMKRLNPMSKIIMLTSKEDSDVILDSFAVGAVNYITKIHYEEIPDAVRCAFHNIPSIHSDSAGVVLQELHRLKQEELNHMITTTEKEVLRLLDMGFTKPQITTELQISENTVKTHIRRLIKKLGAISGKDAAKKAKRKGFF